MIKKIKLPQLKYANFLIVPKPYTNELFSSWFVRMAYAHKTHPRTFDNLYLNLEQSIFSKNIDAAIDSATLKIISKKCHCSLDLFSLTLQSYQGYLQEKIIPNGFNRYVTSLRYCPCCLKEDKIPYFRKEWCVQFSTICIKHHCYLYDACPKCHTKLNISKMFQNKLPYHHCHQCGFDIRDSKTSFVHYSYKNHQQARKELLIILERGYIQLGLKPVYSFHFFKVMAQISKLILNHKKFMGIEDYIPTKILKKWKHQTFKAVSPSYTQISIKEQFFLFSAILHLFSDYPNKLSHYIHDNNLTYWKTLKDMSSVPFWFETIVNNITPRYVPYSMIITEAEIAACKKFLYTQGLIVNKANLTRYLGCNFFSSYNNLS